MSESFMKEKAVLPLVVSMALPNVLSMLVASLYNIVDSYFIAKISEDAMTALSLVYPVQNIISAILIGFGIGVNACVAIHLGKGDQRSANSAATMGFFWNAVHGVVLTIVCIAIMPAFLGAYTDNETVLTYALNYSTIVFAFSIFNACQLSLEKILQSVGRMKTTMVCVMAGCVVNIILDPVMIFGYGPFPEMGIQGAALATGIGQVVSLLCYIAAYIIRPLPVKIHPKYRSFDGALNRRLYAVGMPAALNLGLPSVLISALNAILVSFGETYVLVLGVYYKLQTFLYMTSNGITQGIRPLMGYNYGAKEYGRLRKIYRTALIMSASLMAVGTLVCLLLPEQLFGLFTTESATITLGAAALQIICAGFIISAVSVTTCGSLEGMGKGGPSLVITLLRYVIVIIPAAFLLSRVLGVTGVWWAFPVTELAAAIVSVVLYQKQIRHPAGAQSTEA